MAVNLDAPKQEALLPVAGVQLAIGSAGIKIEGKPDVTLIALAEGTCTAAVYTKNAFCAAPVIVAKSHQHSADTRYLLINSGNANAGTGDTGLDNAKLSCSAVAELANVVTEAVLPFSTGVIGQALPVDKIINVLPDMMAKLDESSWYSAAHAIMTTDTIAKAKSVQLNIAGQTVTITGMSKGSGMIRPDMATMLAYIATDAVISQPVLELMLKQAMDCSFNRITVDGDTSTNDACVLMATAQAKHTKITDIDSVEAKLFVSALNELSQFLAQAIVRDGEGATKFITVNVKQGKDAAECHKVASAIANSPLVKTAMFASDPNWGRILAVVGRSGVEQLDISSVNMYLGDVCIVEQGQVAASYTEEKGQAVMDEAEIDITVELGRGNQKDKVWTCDFSYDYVKINAEYRT